MEHDYLIIGRGAASAVLAYRLAATGLSVGLVDAGGTPPEPDELAFVRAAGSDVDRLVAAGGGAWHRDTVRAGYEQVEAVLRGRDGLGMLPARDEASPSWQKAFLSACAEVGLAFRPSFNGGVIDGSGRTGLTVRRGRRWGAREAFLRPALDRAETVLHADHHATRLRIRGGRVTGVECRHGGRAVRLDARREVLLCAGALGTPALLMASGIGDAADLRRCGIDPVLHLPAVGRDLADHLVATRRYRAGVACATSTGTATAFVRSADRLTDPDLQLGITTPPSFGRPPVGNVLAFTTTLVAPAGRGRVRLVRRGAATAAAVVPGHLTAPSDETGLVAGCRMSRALATARAFRRFGLEALDAPRPGDRGVVVGRRTPTGTCRMGEDDDAVVDGDLRLRGLDGVRVVDASVFPTPMRTGTHAALMMLAWFAADRVAEHDLPLAAGVA